MIDREIKLIHDDLNMVVKIYEVGYNDGDD